MYISETYYLLLLYENDDGKSFTFIGKSNDSNIEYDSSGWVENR